MNIVPTKILPHHRKILHSFKSSALTLHLTQAKQRPHVLKKNHVLLVNEPQLLILACRHNPKTAVYTVTSLYAQRLR